MSGAWTGMGLRVFEVVEMTPFSGIFSAGNENKSWRKGKSGACRFFAHGHNQGKRPRQRDYQSQCQTKHQSWGEPIIADEHIKNNRNMREMLTKSGIFPEQLPPEEEAHKNWVADSNRRERIMGKKVKRLKEV